MATCPKCSAPVDANAVFCPNCGNDMRAQPQAGVPGSPSPMTAPPMQHHRPAGVTIIAVLQVLGGLALLGLGALFLVAASDVARPVLVSALGGIFIVLGLVALFLSYGLWKGARWAWLTTIILQAIVLVADLAFLIGDGRTTGIVGIILSIIIIYYLTRPHVKAYFHRPIVPTM